MILNKKHAFSVYYFRYILFFITMIFISNQGMTYPNLSYYFSEKKNENLETYSDSYKDQIKLFQDALDVVHKNYIHEPDKEKIIDGAISGMLLALDPHSQYLKGEDLEEFKIANAQEFGGIGIVTTYRGGEFIDITAVIEGAAADKAGIKPSDRIVAVDSEPVSTLGYHKAIKRMRGKIHTKVNLSIIEADKEAVKDYELIRENIKVDSVKEYIDDEILYIRLLSFYQNTYNELQNVLSKLNEKKIRGIILDLRDNPGGLLTQAVAVSDCFIKSGVIVSTQGRTPESKYEYLANPSSQKVPKDLPVVVLINHRSASASEIVASALKDHHRAIILGTKSFGKGSTQLTIPFNDAMILLTNSLYYSPNGKSIQAEGVVPDIEVEQAKVELKKTKYNRHLSEKSYTNFIKNENATDDKKDKPSNTELSFKIKSADLQQDYQYVRALDLIRSLILTKNDNSANTGGNIGYKKPL